MGVNFKRRSFAPTKQKMGFIILAGVGCVKVDAQTRFANKRDYLVNYLYIAMMNWWPSFADAERI